MAAEIEAIARAWIQHLGYGDIDTIPTDHTVYGCGIWHGDWDCYDEEGNSRHPLWDALVEACDMANVAVETLESIGWVGPNLPDEHDWVAPNLSLQDKR